MTRHQKNRPSEDIMSIIEIVLIAIGLAMDAFAVSICRGLAMPGYKLRYSIKVGLYFGIAQAVMPLIGYLLGFSYEKYITEYDHWIAFVLLVLIGANMIREAFGKDDEEQKAGLGFKVLFPMAIATSIDALAVGVTFAFLEVNIVVAISIIGALTFFISAAGVKLGSIFGCRFKNKAEFAGGAILILIGTKILIEHLFF